MRHPEQKDCSTQQAQLLHHSHAAGLTDGSGDGGRGVGDDGAAVGSRGAGGKCATAAKEATAAAAVRPCRAHVLLLICLLITIDKHHLSAGVIT